MNTNHPTQQQTPASPDGQTRSPKILDLFRDAAEHVLTEAKNLATQRDALNGEAAFDIQQDREDERSEAEALRALEEIRARRSQRRAVMADRNARINALDAEAQRLEAEGRAADAYITQWEQQGGPVAPTAPFAPVSAEQDGGQAR